MVQLVTFNKLGEQVMKLKKTHFNIHFNKTYCVLEYLQYFFHRSSKCGWAVLFVLKFFVTRLYVHAYMNRRTPILYMYTFFKIPTIHFYLNAVLTFKTTTIRYKNKR